MWFKTGFQGYSVKFSPFEDGRIAVATSQNFGIIGNGKQYVLQASLSLFLATEWPLQQLVLFGSRFRPRVESEPGAAFSSLTVQQE